MNVGLLAILLCLAGVALWRRGHGRLGFAFAVVGYGAAAVWAVVGSPIPLLLVLLAPVPAPGLSVYRQGRRVIAAGLMLIGLGLVVAIKTTT